MRIGLIAVCAILLSCACLEAQRSSEKLKTVSSRVKGFTVERSGDQVNVLLDGTLWAAFHLESKWDKPFLYPIRTVSGLVLSRGYPVEPRAGEERDHDWHRGIWYGHGDINGEDFWREKPDKTTARLVAAGEPKMSGGTFEVALSMMSSKGARMGTISEKYTFRREGANALIDTTIRVSADAGQSLKFGDSDDGGFAFRLSDDFRQDRGADLLNSEGMTGTEKIWGKPARWVKYSANTGGKEAGVAVLDHPSNLRSPSRWHARGYSLCSANPFALRSFTKDKKLDGSYNLPAGETLTLRYLTIIHEGKMTATDVDRYFAEFAGRR